MYLRDTNLVSDVQRCLPKLVAWLASVDPASRNVADFDDVGLTIINPWQS
jgi:hypothetical protein